MVSTFHIPGQAAERKAGTMFSSETTGGTSRLGRRVVAVILAGGTGTRVGLATPKQFLPIAGRSSLEHTVLAFDSAPIIDEIIVVMEPGHLEYAAALLERGRFSKVSAIIAGGTSRNESSRLALDKIAQPDAKVLFHDAVRPLVDHRIIQDCVDALDVFDAVDTAVPSADTIIKVDTTGLIADIPDRSALRRGQTPQAFRRDVIAEAYKRASRDSEFLATDDCSVVLKYLPDVPIHVVSGSESNIKITRPADIHLADKLFQLRAHPLKPDSADLEQLQDTSIVIFGGSSGIGMELSDQLEAVGATVHSLSRRESFTDVRDREDIRRALEKAYTESGRIDHVVLTAGVLDVGPLLEMTDAQLTASLSTNLIAAYMVAQEAHKYLAESRGSLLFFTSSSYTRGRANYSVYSSTKAAIVNLTQALADEWAEDCIKVNCINPARTATQMRVRAFGTEDKSTLLSGAEVAAASAQALVSGMTGQIFDVRLPVLPSDGAE
jgi:ribitol-5-phosphate 2-dehydrogenase (NADP+) / D-ribitol-5-phosphate cytidylyltransferase